MDDSKIYTNFKSLLRRNDFWAIAFFSAVLILSSWILYYGLQEESRKFHQVLGIIVSGVSCSLIAATVFKMAMMESLKKEISIKETIEGTIDRYREAYPLDHIVENLRENISLDKHIDIMEKSLIGLSVDGVILDSKTNFEFAVRMIGEALDSGKEIIEGSLTSDEYFVGNGGDGNFNRAIDAIITKKAKTKHGRDRLARYSKIYKSLEIENRPGDSDQDKQERQKGFDGLVSEWRDRGIQVGEFEHLSLDFLLIKNDGKAEKALVGVFFDEHQKNNDVGWLALYLTSGKPLEKIQLLAHHYHTEAFRPK